MTLNSFKKYTPILVYIAVLLLAFSDTGIQTLILTTIGAHSRILRQIAIWLLFLKVICTRYSKKELFILFPITILSLYNYTICHNNYCIWNILMVASMKDVDFSTLFKVLFYSTLGAMVTVCILSVFHIGGPLYLTDFFGRAAEETRYCFGMYHPNIWHFAFSRCVIFFVLAYKEHLKWPCLCILFILNMIAYYFSISRTGFIATAIFLLFILGYKYCSKFMTSAVFKSALGCGLIGLFSIYTFFLIEYMNTQSARSISISRKFTTGRITQAGTYLSSFPIRLWGTRFPDDGTIFDCGFFRMLSESGWILGIIFIIAFLLLLFLSLKKNWHEVTAVCVFIALYSLYEMYPLTRPSYNIVIFFMSLLVFKNHMTDKQKSSSF